MRLRCFLETHSLRRGAITLALAGLVVAGAVYSPPRDPREEMTVPELCRLVTEGEIVYKRDGSVIAYEAPLGEPARPRIIRPAIRSPLQMWSPLLASASLVIVLLLVFHRRPTSGPALRDEEDADIHGSESIARPGALASMRLSGQLSLGWAMLGIVLVALNLAAVLAALKYYPRPTPPFPSLKVRYHDGRGLALYPPNGSIVLIKDVTIGYQPTHRVWPIPYPSTLQIWSPLITSLAISVLVLALTSSPRGALTVSVRPTAAER